MQIDSYFSLSTTTEGFVREKASKFYAFAFPVSTIDEVEGRLAEVAKQFHDARHVCYAYRLGAKGEVYRANDDGEPSHSAGDPILNELKSKGVSDALCVVVRYFGGTKLGVGGLIKAYGDAAKDALSKNELREVHLTRHLSIRFPYHLTSEVNRVLHHQEWRTASAEYLEDVGLVLEIPLSKWELACAVFKDLGIFDQEN